MRRLADEAEADAGLFRPLDGERGGLHDRHRPETVAAIEHERRGAVVAQLRLGVAVDLAVLDDFQVARQPRHAVAVAAAQIGPHQALRDNRGVLLACAGGHEHFANEAPEFLVADRNTFAGHLPAGKYLSSHGFIMPHTRSEFSENRKWSRPENRCNSVGCPARLNISIDCSVGVTESFAE